LGAELDNIVHIQEILRFEEVDALCPGHIDLLGQALAASLSFHGMEIVFAGIPLSMQFEVVIRCEERVFILTVQLLHELWIEVSTFLKKLFQNGWVIIAFGIQVEEQLWILKHLSNEFRISLFILLKYSCNPVKVQILCLWRELKHLF
jgi:hypothetical protein